MMLRKNGKTALCSEIELAAMEQEMRAWLALERSRNAWRAAAVFGLLCLLWTTWEMLR